MVLGVTLNTLDELMDVVLMVEACLTAVIIDSTSVNPETSEVLSCSDSSVEGLNVVGCRVNSSSVCVASDGVDSCRWANEHG